MSLHEVWTRPIPPDPGEAIGREARERQRAAEAHASLYRLQAVVLRESPELAAGTSPPEGQTAIDRLVQRVQDEAESPADWRRQHNFLAAAIDQGNRRDLWALVAPNPFLDLKRDPLLRDEAYFRRGSVFVAIRQQFVAALHQLHRHEKRWQQSDAGTLAAYRGGLVLASASLFGGLCNANMLALLPGTLRTAPVQQCGEQLWVDLRVPESGAQRLNLVGEDEALHRWCPDELTAALLAYFRQHHGPLDFPEVHGDHPSAQAKQALRIIRELMTDLGISIPPGITPNQWGLGAWAALEREPGAPIPAYLGEYAVGRTPSCSLPVDRWVALLNQQVSLSGTPVDSTADGTVDKPSVVLPRIRAGVPAKDTQKVVRRLLKVFQSQSSKKLTRAQCRQALEDLMDTDAIGDLVATQLLTQWAIVLLSHGSSSYQKPLAPSTVYGSYLAPIVHPILSLLSTSEPNDLRDFDSDEFEQLYEDVLQQSRWKEKSTPANALQEFHHFLTTHHGCPSLETPIAHTTRGTPRVRALIVTEAEFQAIRRSIRSSSSHNGTERENLEIALILGFRAGLRPDEALKLRLQDVFVGPTDTIVTVRTNRYGSNKNRPSLRRIDLAALCPEDEHKWFSEHVARLQAFFNNQPQALLISKAPNRDIRADRTFLETLLQPTIRQVTGNPHVLYYSLRHSALTRLHLRSEIPTRDHEIHDPEDNNPVDDQLVPRLTGGQPDSMKRLHMVAAIAGHASPEMTLTTYLHGLDLILYEKVRATLPRLDAVVFAQLLGRPYQSVKRYLKDHRQPVPASAASLRPWIIQALPTEKHPPPSKRPEVTPPAIEPESPRSLTVNDIVRILTDHDHGYPSAVIAKRSGAEQAQCEDIIDAARRIAAIRSNKGRPRFVTQRRRERFSGTEEPLAPSYPSSEQDIQLAARMIERLRPLIPTSGPLGDIGPAIEYFLQHVEANNSGVRFYQPAEAKPFIELLGAIADDRGLLFGTHVYSEKSRIDERQQRNRWEKRLNINVRSDPSRSLKRDGGRYGKLTVSLQLQTEDGRFVSSHAYKYVLHLAAIALLARRRIQIDNGAQSNMR